MKSHAETRGFNPMKRQSLQQRRRKEGGFTIAELMVVVAVGSVLIVSGLKLAPQLWNDSKVHSETQNIEALVTRISNTFQGNYTNLSNAMAVQLQTVPPDMLKKGGNSITGNWGGVTVSATTTSVGGPAFVVQMVNIPSKICPQLVANLAAISEELLVNGTSVQSLNNSTSSLDVTQTANACTQGGVSSIFIIHT